MMNRSLVLRSVISLAAAVLIARSPAPAQTPPALKADLAHSQAQFAVKHFVVSTVRGAIKFTAVNAAIGSDSPIPTAIDATLDPSTVNSGDDGRDHDLRSDKFFDVEKYPTMSFKSTKITPGDGKNFTIAGDLTMHGVTKPVTFAAQFLGNVTDSRGNQRFVYSATTKIDRRDFGIDWAGQTPGGSLVAGYDIDLSVNVELVKTSA